MERAGGDEQDVVGTDDPILGRDRRALDDRKKVALNALAAHVRAVAPFAPRNLVELVEEDDARVLGTPDGLGDRLIHIDELLGLLLGQEPPRLGDPHLPALRPAWHDVREHVLEVDAHLLHALAGQNLDHRQRLLLHLQLDETIVQPPSPELLAELVLGRLARGVRRDFLERAR